MARASVARNGGDKCGHDSAVLSVVIPTYNTAAMTLRCVQAVEADELIVVDDGSTDDTAALLSPAISMERNSGFAAAANRGVAAARGDIILLLNSDAIVQPGAIRALLAAFDDPRVGIAGAQLLNEDGTPQWSGGRAPTLLWLLAVVSGLGPLFSRRRGVPSPRRGEKVPEGRMRGVDWVSGAAMAFRAEVWRAAGPLEESYRFYCQDLELCMRGRAAGWEVRVVGEARVVHAQGATIAGGSALHHDPSKLWPDLFDWGRSRYGWGLFAKYALVLAGWLRAVVTRDPAIRRAAAALRRS
jgi:N-acetylglucosaminyl-diphospho-decaprenol L-rhamnosyltransferase